MSETTIIPLEILLRNGLMSLQFVETLKGDILLLVNQEPYQSFTNKQDILHTLENLLSEAFTKQKEETNGTTK